jgi:hypothetical protein
MGVFAGSVPWFTMMILHKKSALLMSQDASGACCGQPAPRRVACQSFLRAVRTPAARIIANHILLQV